MDEPLAGFYRGAPIMVYFKPNRHGLPEGLKAVFVYSTAVYVVYCEPDDDTAFSMVPWSSIELIDTI